MKRMWLYLALAVVLVATGCTWFGNRDAERKAAIEQVLDRIAQAIVNGKKDELAAVFVQDVKTTVRGPEAIEDDYDTRDELIDEFYRLGVWNYPQVTLTERSITVSGDDAVATGTYKDKYWDWNPACVCDTQSPIRVTLRESNGQWLVTKLEFSNWVRVCPAG